MRKAASCAVILTLSLLIALAVLPEPADVISVDESIPFGEGRTHRLGFEAGPLVFEEIIVRNPPNEEDLRKAELDPDDNCHPKLQLGISNKGTVKMEVEATIRFEGEDGTLYMECERSDTVEPGARNDHTNFCWLDSMKTIDWPKVKRLRVVALVYPDR